MAAKRIHFEAKHFERITDLARSHACSAVLCLPFASFEFRAVHCMVCSAHPYPLLPAGWVDYQLGLMTAAWKWRGFCWPMVPCMTPSMAPSRASHLAAGTCCSLTVLITYM